MTKPTLDQIAAQCAQAIVKDLLQQERLDVFVTKALGVLQEQGVYACMLFLYSRTEKNEKAKAAVVRDHLLGILETLKKNYKVSWVSKECEHIPQSAKNDSTFADVLNFYADCVASDLDTLLLVRDLYEQTLIYARYGAKAAERGKSKEE
jgi:hypothetical protein